jgi:MFS family permease
MSAQQDESTESPPVEGGWRSAVRGNVLMMGLVSLFTDFSSEMINPILPVFFAYLVGGRNAALWVGVSEGIAEATASILKLFSGRISDRLGRRKPLVIAGYGTSTLARPAIALAMSPWFVVLMKFFDRVGKGLRTSPRDALIGDSVDPNYRGLAFSFHRLMDHVGAVLGPLAVIGILHAFLGYARWIKPAGHLAVSDEEAHAMKVLFAVALIPGILAMLSLVLKVREIRPVGREQRPGEGLTRLSVWKQLPRRFYAFVGIAALFALGNSSDMFLLLWARDLYGMSLEWLAVLWIVLHLSKIVFSLPGGMLSDKLGRRPIIIVGWLVYALVYLGMSRLGGGTPQWCFWALFIAYGFYFGMTEGSASALVADFVPSANRGSAFGVYHGAIGIAALPASLIFGVFWAVIGPKVAFGIGAALAALAVVLLGVLLSTSRRPA